MTKAPEPTLQDVKDQVTDWLDLAIEGAGEMDPDALSHAAVKHFAGDAAFAVAWFRATLRQAVAQYCRRLAKDDPSLARQGDRLVPRPVLRAALESAPAAWERFIEVDPTTEREIPILEMGKAELLRAAEKNREEGHDRYVRADLLERLAEPMQDGERVRDRWTWDDVADLESRLQAAIRNGLVERVDVRGVAD